MLRNPLEVIHSLHSQNVYDGNEDVFDFETALGLDDNRKKGMDLPRSADFWHLPGYKDSVLFSKQVKRYLDVFPKENVHIILYEDFTADTQKSVLEVLQFLEVDPAMNKEFGVINPNKTIKSFFLHRLIKHPLPGFKKLIRWILPIRRIRHSIMAFILRRNITNSKRKSMDACVRAHLVKFLAEDIACLSRIISRDLSSWQR